MRRFSRERVESGMFTCALRLFYLLLDLGLPKLAAHTVSTIFPPARSSRCVPDCSFASLVCMLVLPSDPLLPGLLLVRGLGGSWFGNLNLASRPVMMIQSMVVAPFTSALPCLALPCLALPCLALPCLALPCLASPCRAAPCFACPSLASPRLALSCLAGPENRPMPRHQPKRASSEQGWESTRIA